ncbi:ribosome maturation factor RimP [Pseudonocardia sp. GCM10023141]|uniref:ribosome maturation factor RimP n=1 Tax=Pseudonocardia sp. GCM10023141 TaxID=3252653 RepID=UPI0036199342
MSSPRPVRQSAGQQLSGRLHGVLEPVITDAGFDLEELDVRTVGRRHTVKVVVDSDTGVGLDDIAMLSRAASEVLDQHDELINGAFTLEVTSPGTDRPLTQLRHWRRAFLRLVAVRTKDGATLAGRVGRADTDSVTVLVGGKRQELRYADVTHAAVEVEFRTPPESELELLRGKIETTPEETS